jgi:molecular chaperone GrpE (heat shock protein)
MRGPAAERIEQYKKIQLIDKLRLDEELAIRFFARYTKHTNAVREIAKERNKTIDQLQHLENSEGNDKEYDAGFKDLRDIESKLAEERNRFLEQLKEIFTKKQIAAYIVFERTFNQNLRELMKDVAKERWNQRNR